MSTADFLTARQRYLDYLHTNEGKSVRTVEVYALALDRLFEYMGGRSPLEATHDDLVLFTGRWLYDKGVGPRGRRPYVAAVRTFFAWCAAGGGYLTKSPAAGVVYPKAPPKYPLKLTLENAEKLLHCPDLSTFIGLRDSAMLHILLGVGVRVSALVGMNEGDLVADRIGGKPRLLVKVREKGGREELKLLPQEADLVLRMYLDSPDLKRINRTILSGPANGDRVLFVSTNNHKVPPDVYVGEKRRISRWAVRNMIHAYGSAVGIPENQLHPHAARHLYGTELVESDVHLSRVQNAMGHRDPKSTAIYVHLAQAKNALELDRANPLAKMTTPISQILARLQRPGQK